MTGQEVAERILIRLYAKGIVDQDGIAAIIVDEVTAAIDEEREACAKVAECGVPAAWNRGNLALDIELRAMKRALTQTAAAIRARKPH